jgi:hypothetical protein
MRSIKTLARSGILLRLLPQQFEWLQYWYYRWKGFMKYAAEVASDGVTYQVL